MLKIFQETLHPLQFELQDKEPSIITEFNFIGARASGKTNAEMEVGIHSFLMSSKNIIYIFREKHGDLDNYKSELFPKLEALGFRISQKNYNAKLNSLTNGYNKIIFKSLNAKALSVEKGSGAGLPVWPQADNIIAIFEEATQMDESLVNIAIQGLRGHKDTNIVTLFAANPWSPLNWYVRKCNNYLPESLQELRDNGFQSTVLYDENRKKKIAVVRNNILSNPFCKQEVKDELMSYENANYNMWLITAMGMSGVLGDLIYSTNLNVMQEVDYNFINGPSGVFQGGLDWGDGSSIGASPTTMHFGKICSMQGVHVIAEKTIWNNRQEKHTTNDQIDKVIDFYKQLYIKHKRPFKVYVDNAALSDFYHTFNSRLELHGMNYNHIEFLPCIKPSIESRIDLINTMLSTGFYRVDKKACEDLYSALANSTWVKQSSNREGVKKVRNHTETHWINSGAEYILGNEYHMFVQKWTYMFDKRS